MSAPPSVDFAAADPPCERYGLRLVAESAAAVRRPEEPSDPRPLRPFDWGLLAGFAALEIAHLAGLAVLARWVLRRLIGS